MDALGCMKSLLLAATQYRAAKTPPNAALLRRSLEVSAAPVVGPRVAVGAGQRGGAAGNVGLAMVFPRPGGTGGSSRCPISAGSSASSSLWAAAARAWEHPGPWPAPLRRCP